MIEEARYEGRLPDMERVVVGVDPSGFDSETGDSQGIIIAGKARSRDGAYWVLDDRSVRLRPEAWGRQVIRSCRDYNADRIVLERNFGGDMARAVVEAVMPGAPISMVTATRGKIVRAEPIAALYEQRKVKHARPFPELEDQLAMMTTQGWMGAGSPDRADALVWALTELQAGGGIEIIGIF